MVDYECGRLVVIVGQAIGGAGLRGDGRGYEVVLGWIRGASRMKLDIIISTKQRRERGE